jgi:hypothetical protein
LVIEIQFPRMASETDRVPGLANFASRGLKSLPVELSPTGKRRNAY